MKHTYFFLIAILLLITTNLLKAQSNEKAIASPEKKTTTEAFQKGTSQIAIQDLSFSLFSGRAVGGAEIRYGYFIADNNLLFINAGYYSWGTAGSYAYNLGLNYRRYFTSNTIKPFAQIGFNRNWTTYNTWETSQDITSVLNEVIVAGGAAVQIKRFGIEAGVQCIITDAARFAPLVGFTFKF